MSDDLPDLDDLDDFIAELDSTLKKDRSSATPKKKAATTWSEPTNIPTWIPRAVELHTTVQQCTCGCMASSIDGLFAVDSTPNGFLRHKRVECIPETHTALPRTLKETLAMVPFCPACFTPSATIATPGEPNDSN